MRIGDLNKRIEIQEKTQISDGMGGFIDTHSTEATVWAAIWPVSAKEQLQSVQMTMVATHQIRIRYRKILKPDWRIKFGNRYFNIVSIINQNEANRMLDMLCNEINV